MDMNCLSLKQAATALNNAVVGREFESLPRLSLAYRKAVTEAAQGPDYWQIGHESVSLEPMVRIMGGQEYIGTSTATELALIIESFPVNLWFAEKLIENKVCPKGQLVEKLILTEPVLDFSPKSRSFMLDLAKEDPASADKLLIHVLATQKPDSIQLGGRENLDYMFATIEAIGRISKRLAGELKSMDAKLSQFLTALVENNRHDPMCYQALAILYRSGCRELCRTALLRGVLYSQRDSFEESFRGWRAVAEAGVPIPGDFVKDQCRAINKHMGTSNDGERLGFVFYQYLAGRRLNFASLSLIANQTDKLKDMFKGLSFAYTASQDHGLDVETRLLPLLSFLVEKIQKKEVFLSLAMESSIPGNVFALLPSMKKYHGRLFTNDMGV